ncbi:hypothetical protein ACFQT0_26890 [Hymenobacter humi]|uniref:Uncharacterized protein n=1 Tax=Hymenobacter humi TaxID=1411620 RepID=A0ABW2UAP0_9BACT
MFDFHKQAAFQAKLAQVYERFAPTFKAAVSQQDFIEAFPIIEIGGRGTMPTKPDAESAFLLTDEEFERVLAAFETVYGPR